MRQSRHTVRIAGGPVGPGIEDAVLVGFRGSELTVSGLWIHVDDLLAEQTLPLLAGPFFLDGGERA